MKRILPLLFLVFIQLPILAQIITGSVVDSESNSPLEYVSVGVVGTRLGTISDKNGQFQFDTRGEHDKVVRISMIGYKSKEFTIDKLLNTATEIQLVKANVELEEVIIHPSKEITLGALKANKSLGWSGWGGERTRKGYEMGIVLDLGSEPVQVKELNVKLKRQSFTKSLFRLHIRELTDNNIGHEILNENIILTITQESGWVTLDLRPYNIVVGGTVGVTLEWLEVMKNNPERAIKINRKTTDAYFLFQNAKNHVGLYRWGVESNWIIEKEHSPCINLNVRK
jgi:hypothetical protein